MPSYQLSDEAEEDLRSIVAYTAERHGTQQVLTYIDRIEQCAEDLANGDGHYNAMPELHAQLRFKHCQHHYLFGIMRESAPMLVIAILHERMDIIRRIKGRLQ